jgi:sialic acid synthase SpsE
MTGQLHIGDRTISKSSPCFIIAEAGTSHEGDLARAVELIDASAEAGADCVKFQAVFADEIVHPNTGYIRLPDGDVSIFDSFRRVERGETFYRALASRCRERSVEFLCTPFGTRSARLLEDIGVTAYKIASPELNHAPLVSQCAETGRPCILSTGVSRISDIEAAISLFSGPVGILHCVTAYPAHPTDYNIKALDTLSRLFGVPVGVSDHSLQTDLVPVLSVLSGARMVEKHVTLSKDGHGLDDKVALSPREFAQMVASIRHAEAMPAGADAEILSRYGARLVDTVRGDGVKRMARSEEQLYRTTNRTIISVRPIAVGEQFDVSNIRLLRSETNIQPGLEPVFLDELLRRVAARDICDGQGVSWGDVGARTPE